ncbi:MAG TPA: radical SAM/SPASM domain-containing protein [Polyangiaceae bacterium]|nr:radical SAM/SPASM domain-containing protein [Polyangiaceae bacterium]
MTAPESTIPRSTLAPSLGERHQVTRLFHVMPPPIACSGARITPRRIQNLIQANHEEAQNRVALRSMPSRLTIEATNVCNLRCPACFTGTEQIGRRKGHLSMDLFRRVLAELGPYLLEMELYNWGEPLLGKHVFEMIEEAARAGVSTTVSTNFSIPFEDADAERLVRSGLSVLAVSVDGARQETYEQYRVRGNLALVLENCRRVADAKRRLGAATPRLIWAFHVFPHNVGDIEEARRLARDLGMDLAVDKGWLIGADWDEQKRFEYALRTPEIPSRCSFLWHQGIVNPDGGVAPCCGTFYREDDVGRLSTAEGDGGATTFRDVWNGERQRKNRAFFLNRDASGTDREMICRDCPVTVRWDRWLAYLRSGAPPGTFEDVDVATGVNYFWTRVPPGTAEERGLVALRRKPRA